MRMLRVLDVTLRDGAQAPGFFFSRENKVRLARLLDAAGVSWIEAGIPGMGKEERGDIRAVKQACSSARVSTWNRARREDIEAALDCGADLLHICMPVSKLHILKKLGMNPEEAAAGYLKCAARACGRGAAVSAGFEDASRADEGFMLRLALSLAEEGVSRIRISDTVGVLTPLRAASLVRLLAAAVPELEIHAHNDLGMAEANSLCAALAGATYVNTSVLGIGERAGNCGLARFTRLAARCALFALDLGEEEAARVEREAAPLLRRDEALLSGRSGVWNMRRLPL
ncbi:MAG: homocitrate synthase [Deltaproteobacteria bacterium]|jgi:homocitrate synthase NifV|nr:homocitrate synthase [Deltaproteobacteria bacterium]